MVNKIVKWISATIGFILGYQMTVLILSIDFIEKQGFVQRPFTIISYIIGGIIFAIIFYLLSPIFIKLGKKVSNFFETLISGFSISEIIFSTVGLIIGLIIAALISLPINSLDILPLIKTILMIVVYVLLGYLGISISHKNSEFVTDIIKKIPKEKDQKPKKNTSKEQKILDTSVIIDGRIFDICKTGFVEGIIVIPRFVLAELQYIADSSDGLKRNRGRRGLDVLNRIQKELDIEVVISEKDYPNINEVDAKLLKLAQDTKSKVVTNDYNLNKVAEFQGVYVLNINELANAVKPVVLPGEEMVVHVIKDGKESGQGVAYLDDGTMIVVENGRKYVGDTIEVTVTSVLQTAAGRMIFAKPKKLIHKSA